MIGLTTPNPYTSPNENRLYKHSNYVPLFSLFQDDAVEDFDQVYDLESRARDAAKSLLRIFLSTKEQYSWVRNWQISGSLMEGCFSPSLFMGNGSLKKDGTLAMDIDAELILAKLPATYRKCIIDTKPGFINFQAKDNGCEFFDRLVFSMDNVNKSTITDENGFL